MKQNSTFTSLKTKWQIKIVALFMLLFSANSIQAQSFSTGNINYDVTSPTTVVVSNQNQAATGNVTIPAQVTYNGASYSVTSIVDYAFFSCTSLTTVTIPNSVTSIGGEAFHQCFNLTSITIPNSVTSIGEYTFHSCYSLTSVTIPNTLTTLNTGIFGTCSSLASVTIPNSVTSIAPDAFNRCSSLTSITIPNSVTSIGHAAFAVCSSLASVTIPNSVTSIDYTAFQDCISLTSFTCNITSPLAINADVFQGVTQASCSLKVPAGSLAAYQAAAVWQDFMVSVSLPTSKIQASQAGGRLPDLNTVIVADWFSSSVSQYRFKVVNGATTRTIETPNRGFSLSSLSGGGTYNTTYTISVAVRVNNNWGIYGVESLVSTPIIPPATKVVVTQCGTTLPDLYTVIVATWISGVTNYKFEVVNGATTRYIETTNRGFSLSSLVGGGTYNTTYTIRVATKAAGLDWGAYGIPCTVTTPTVPPATKIIDTQCGKVLPTLNTVIVATWISGVSGYRFEVVNGTTTRIIDTPNRGFSLSSLVGRGAYSTTYTISVATKVGTADFGSYGDPCQVTTPSDSNTSKVTIESKTIVANEVSVKVYPNPFTSNFKLDFSSSSDANVEIVVYDMIGRQLEKLQVVSSEMNNTELGNNYPSGVYNVIVTQGEEVKTLRVIKR